MQVGDWIMGSGAFTEISKHVPPRRCGLRRRDPTLGHERQWPAARRGAEELVVRVVVAAKTGTNVEQHPRLTIECFDELRAQNTAGVYVLPVLQGFAPADVRHRPLAGSKRHCRATARHPRDPRPWRYLARCRPAHPWTASAVSQEIEARNVLRCSTSSPSHPISPSRKSLRGVMVGVK